jgi:hypothetical protein
MKLLIFFMLLLAQTVSSQIIKESDLVTVTNQAEIVVVGEIVCSNESPGVWSGVVLSVQRIRYRVMSVLKGSLTSSYIDVGHFVVKNSKTADSKKPRLNLDLFFPGNRLVLFLTTDSGKGYISISKETKRDESTFKRFLSMDANYGAIPADDLNILAAQRIISTNK